MNHFFCVKKPLHPLVSLFFTYSVFIMGMIIASSTIYPVYLLFFLFLLWFFGYALVSLKAALVIVPLAIFSGLFSYPNGGLPMFLQVATRTLCLGIAAVPMISLSPVRLTRCLNKLKCPRHLTLGLLITIKFVPFLLAEMRLLRTAMKTRGITAWCSPKIIYRAYIIPFVMRLLSISEMLSVSLETRAFAIGTNSTTVFEAPQWQMRDTIFSGLSLTGLVAAGIMVKLAS